MDNTELEKRIIDLENKLSEKDKLFEELKNIVNTHTHSGNDGSDYIYKDTIKLKPGTGISTGKFQMIDANVNGEYFGGLVIGDEAEGSGIIDSSKNSSQLTVDHFSGSLNSFYYGYRSPFYSAISGSVTSGGTTMSQTKFSWATNELAGAFIIVNDSANTTPTQQFDAYEIASNTSSTITITGGTWSFTDINANFVIFMPIYLGASQFPWRRIYTTDGIGGGIRFGMGDTNGGQNALLYTDGTALKFRKKDGTITTVTIV